MKNLLTISEMAEIHNLSRQTLIYYDKIGLFMPENTDNNGYRYYSPYQIPFLREICFLKSLGIKLEEIKEHIKNRNLTTAISLLEYHQEMIDKEINKLSLSREFIQDRLNIYTNAADLYKEDLYKPMIDEFPERKAVFFPFQHGISKKELHLTTMQAWNIIVKHGTLPSEGFGTIIMKEELEKESIFEGAGCFVSIPPWESNIENIITFPAGQYVCMYKYGMPYDTEFLFNLLDWIKSNQYTIVGNIIDACVLDTTFYDKDQKSDFSQLQIPIQKLESLSK